MVAEHHVLGHRLPRAHRLEERPQVRPHVVEIGPAERNRLPHRHLLAHLRIVLLVPLGEVRLAQRPGVAACVIAGVLILAGLWRESQAGPGHLEQALRALDAIRLRHFRSQIQPHVHGQPVVVVDDGLHVGHVAAVLPAPDAAHRARLLGRGIDPHHVHHPADQVHQQVAGHAGAVLLPAAPPREDERIERALGDGPLPRVPVEVPGREIGGRGILPRTGGVVAPEPALDEHQVAERALRDQLLGLRTDLGAHALRADLNDAARPFRRVHHGHAVGGAVRHRLLAVDVLPGAHRIHHHLLVPVIGHGRHDAVDVLVVEQLLIAARDGEIGPHDLARQRVPTVVQVAGGGAFDAGQLDGLGQEPVPLHADADHAEPHPVAGRAGGWTHEELLGKGPDVLRGERCPCRRTRPQEFATRPVVSFHVHGVSLSRGRSIM